MNHVSEEPGNIWTTRERVTEHVYIQKLDTRGCIAIRLDPLLAILSVFNYIRVVVFQTYGKHGQVLCLPLPKRTHLTLNTLL